MKKINLESQKNFIPCKYRDITYADYTRHDEELTETKQRSGSDLEKQRKTAKWYMGFCSRPIMNNGVIHSYFIYDDFDIVGQFLVNDVKILNPLHVLLLRLKKRIYTTYTKLKIKLTGKIDQGIIQKTTWYLEKRIIDLEISADKCVNKDAARHLSDIACELKTFESKFNEYIKEEKRK